ncbi:hypothetical protein WMY93_000338 [Mugilogobius chulae]|uniref:Uncharacterized protein n=1 Tax=Mugilogobius chulae TaxID=88201 RepID=A0AAW0Q258_9GOBI
MGRAPANHARDRLSLALATVSYLLLNSLIISVRFAFEQLHSPLDTKLHGRLLTAALSGTLWHSLPKGMDLGTFLAVVMPNRQLQRHRNKTGRSAPCPWVTSPQLIMKKDETETIAFFHFQASFSELCFERNGCKQTGVFPCVQEEEEAEEGGGKS